MIEQKKLDPLFVIDYQEWQLPKSSETGLPIEPVPIQDFDRFEYWNDKNNNPVRQVISLKELPLYADYLNLNNASLYRRVSSLIGVSPYDDEISKEQYEELCQIALLENKYRQYFNYEILIPFQSKALTFYKFQEKTLINKAKTFYEVNCKNKIIEKSTLTSDDIFGKAKLISEYEFYSSIIHKLINNNGLIL